MKANRAGSDSANYLRMFLRERRSRIRPEELGLPGRHSRGTGLRREDVAELLEVSPIWYALFESGTSGRRFSGAFLERLQEILRLDEADYAQLIDLVVTSGHASPAVEARWYKLAFEIAQSTLQTLLAATASEPAFARQHATLSHPSP